MDLNSGQRKDRKYSNQIRQNIKRGKYPRENTNKIKSHKEINILQT